MRRPSPAMCPPADTGSESPPRQVPWKAPPIHQGLVRFSEVTPQVPAASRPAGQATSFCGPVPLHRGALHLPDNEKVQWRTVAPALVLLGRSTGEHGVGSKCDLSLPQKDSVTYPLTKQGWIAHFATGHSREREEAPALRAHGPRWAALQLTVAQTAQNEYDRHHHDELKKRASQAFWRTSWKKLLVR